MKIALASLVIAILVVALLIASVCREAYARMPVRSRAERKYYKEVEIYGPYNSGTNLLDKFIRKNFKAKRVEQVWKHTLWSMPDSCPSESVLRLTIMKSPMLWIASCLKRDYGGSGELSRGRLLSPGRRMGLSGMDLALAEAEVPDVPPAWEGLRRGADAQIRRYRNLPEVWASYSDLYRYHPRFRENSRHIPYEELLHHTQEVGEEIAQYLEPKTSSYRLPNKPSKTHGRSRGKPESLKWYTPENEAAQRLRYPEVDALIRAHCDGLESSDYGSTEPQDFLSVIVRVRNEPYIEEFCRWHFSQGTDRIYVQDDNLAGYSWPDFVVRDPRVEISPVPTLANRIQVRSYNDLYKKIRGRSEWFAIIDADEYLVPGPESPYDTVRAYLKSLPGAEAVVQAPWVMMTYTYEEDPPTLLDMNVHREGLPNTVQVKSLFRSGGLGKVGTHRPPGEKKGSCFELGGGLSMSKRVKNARNHDRCVRESPLLCYHYRYTSEERYNFKMRYFDQKGYAGQQPCKMPGEGRIPEPYMKERVRESEELRPYYEARGLIRTNK